MIAFILTAVDKQGRVLVFDSKNQFVLANDGKAKVFFNRQEIENITKTDDDSKHKADVVITFIMTISLPDNMKNITEVEFNKSTKILRDKIV